MKKNYANKEDPMLVLLDAMMSEGNPSDAILRQESRGQENFVKSETLPRKYYDQSLLEGWGIVFGEAADDLFVYVTLPDGWIKRPTDHSMWSELVDGEGKVRATIFYKAAFYDRDAFMNISK